MAWEDTSDLTSIQVSKVKQIDNIFMSKMLIQKIERAKKPNQINQLT